MLLPPIFITPPVFAADEVSNLFWDYGEFAGGSGFHSLIDFNIGNIGWRHNTK